MRSLFSIASVLLLTVAFAMAESSNATNSQTAVANARQMTIEGCLSHANGAYALTDSHGNVWTLEGSPNQLKNDLGHSVAITGRGGDAAFMIGNPTKYVDVYMALVNDFQVSNVRQISAACSTQNQQYARMKAGDMLAAG